MVASDLQHLHMMDVSLKHVDSVLRWRVPLLQLQRGTEALECDEVAGVAVQGIVLLVALGVQLFPERVCVHFGWLTGTTQLHPKNSPAAPIPEWE